MEPVVPRRAGILFGDLLVQRGAGDIERSATEQCYERVSTVS